MVNTSEIMSLRQTEEYVRKLTINHFCEKLLLLKNYFNTVTAIEMAKKRHIFMEQFFTE